MRAEPLIKAPALVGLKPKSLQGEEQLILRACDAARGHDQEPLPVVADGHHLGWVMSDPWWVKDRGVYFWQSKRRPDVPPAYWCGFSSYDDLISEVSTNGKFLKLFYSKNASTAGVANNYYDLWTVGGHPSAGSYTGSSLTAVRYDDTITGSIYHGGNVSTDTKHLLSVHMVSTASTPVLILFDRVITYESNAFNNNANANFTNTLTAQRYNGNTDGGLKICVTAQTVFSSNAGNITQIQYTDNEGNTLQTMPQSPVPAWIVSAAAPTATLGARVVSPATTATTIPWGPYMPLAAGDGGVQLIANWTTSTNAQTGTTCIILLRPLAVLPVSTAGVTHMMDTIQQVMGLVKIWDGACLCFLSYVNGTSANIVMGGLDVAWG